MGVRYSRIGIDGSSVGCVGAGGMGEVEGVFTDMTAFILRE